MKKFTPEEKKALRYRAIAAILLLLFVILVYLPKNKRVNELKGQLKDIEEEIKAFQSMTGDTTKLSQLLAGMQQELVYFENRLPYKEQISSIISELSNLAKASSVEVVEITPQEPAPLFDNDRRPIAMGAKVLKGLRIELKLSGSYKAIAEYIRSIQKSLNLLATIDEIRIARNKETAPAVNVELNFTVYVCS